MTLRKVCGFDLNGWRDFAARNWRTIPGQEEQIGQTDVIGGGALSSVVNVGDGRWIGGPQADIAPHGLGGGWGEVGREDRRISVRSLIEGRELSSEKLAAAFTGLARGAAYNVVSIDDSPENSELAQERMLAALAAGKFRSPMLVWRPVLAALYALEKGLVAGEQSMAVICHSKRGFLVQKLLIRRASERSNDIFAPERRQASQLVQGNIGYETLVFNARQSALSPDGISARTAHRAQDRSVGRAALGLSCRPEMLRKPNGNWDKVDLSNIKCLKYPLVNSEWPDLSDCSAVLVETLAEGIIRSEIVEFIRECVSNAAIELSPEAVAKGALIAARRMADGDPVYFDFLPSISTIVFGSNGASNFDLVNADETLEAGRIYRSPKPAELAIPPGQLSISIYLRKETEEQARKATIDLEKPLSHHSPVSLWVEQKPVAGRARIVMEAADLGRYFTIDWDGAEEDDRPWGEIIESLKIQTSIPARLTLKCGLHPWEDNNRSVGLFTLLAKEPSRLRVDWDTLASKLSSRPFGEYCISSDGELPTNIDDESIRTLDRLTEIALGITRSRLNRESGSETEDNAALRFLTWQFRRCPSEVVDWLVDCISKRGVPHFNHPFVQNPSSWKLVYQGLGRIVSSGASEERVLRLLLSSQVHKWVWNTESACMAFLLSRSDTAPLFLKRDDVEALARRTIADFKRNLGTEYNMFYYAPFLLAGLLRWRLKEKKALLIGVDPLGADFLAAIEDAELDLMKRRNPSERFLKKRDKYLPILQDLKAELSGEGANPDLLLDIYSAN